MEPANDERAVARLWKATAKAVGYQVAVRNRVLSSLGQGRVDVALQ